MDLFTHVLLGYLVSFGLVGLQPQYLAAGALAGGLPDADVLFWPLARRFPILRHHGITHSIFGVSVVAAVGGFLVAPTLAAGSPWVYFAVMEAAGLAHVAGDGFTHFSVPPFLPFSEWKLELDADRAINLVNTGVSIFAFWLLIDVERGHVPIWEFLLTIYVLSAFFAGYVALRLAGRYWAGRHKPLVDPRAVAIPTSNPLAWVLHHESVGPDGLHVRLARVALGRGVTHGPYRLDVPPAPASTGPVASREEALARSYAVARERSPMFRDTYQYADVVTEDPEGWTVDWFSLEFTFFGRGAGLRVRLARDGRVETRRAWPRVPWSRPTP